MPPDAMHYEGQNTTSVKFLTKMHQLSQIMRKIRQNIRQSHQLFFTITDMYHKVCQSSNSEIKKRVKNYSTNLMSLKER